jgi:transcriptional regulator with XRE-family HTH domain
MNMKSLNDLKEKLKSNSFDLEHESNMVQSRILSTLLDIVELKKITQQDLEKKTGLTQPFLSALFHNRRKLNMNHIALLQKALDIVLQPPNALTTDEHNRAFYSSSDFEIPTEILNDFDDFDQVQIFSDLSSPYWANNIVMYAKPDVVTRKSKGLKSRSLRLKGIDCHQNI